MKNDKNIYTMELKDQLKDLFQAQNQKPKQGSQNDTYSEFQTWVIGARNTLDYYSWKPNEILGGNLEYFTKEDWAQLDEDLSNPYYLHQSILVLQQMEGLYTLGLTRKHDPIEYREAWLMMLNGNTSWLNNLQIWYFG